jgi:hypothetical protein
MKRLLFATSFLVISVVPSLAATCSNVSPQLKDSAGVTFNAPYVDDDTGSGDCLPEVYVQNTLNKGPAIPANSSPVVPSTWIAKIANALTNSGVAVKASAGQFGGVQCYNPNATVAYVQIYNATSITGTPVQSYGIAPTATGGVSITGGLAMSTGIEIQAATTATGSSAPSSAMDCNVWYN